MSLIGNKLPIAVALTGMMSFSGAANATQYYFAQVWEGEDAATTWKYRVTGSKPGDGSDCIANGNDVQFVNTGYEVGPNVVQVVSVSAPFGGSKTGSNYITVCKGSAYAVVYMEIHLTSCGMWVCQRHNHYSVDSSFGGTFSARQSTSETVAIDVP